MTKFVQWIHFPTTLLKEMLDDLLPVIDTDKSLAPRRPFPGSIQISRRQSAPEETERKPCKMSYQTTDLCQMLFQRSW
jgi:hypothetical protein